MDRLLIVDDELDNLYWLQEMFQYEFEPPIEVSVADSAREALKLLNSVKFDVVLTDIRMPGMDGIHLFEKIKENWPACMVIFLTAYKSFDQIYTVMQNRDVKFILKSEDEETIKDTVREAFEEIRNRMKRKVDEERFRRARYALQKEAFGTLLEEIQKREKRGKNGMDNMPEAVRENISLNLQCRMLCTLIRMAADLDTVMLMQTIEQYLPEVVKGMFYAVDAGNLVLLTQFAEGEEDWRRLFILTQGALEYAQEAMEIRGYTFSALLSSIPIEIGEFSHRLLWLRQIWAGTIAEEMGVIAHAEVLSSENVRPEAEEAEEKEDNGRPELIGTCLRLKRREPYFAILGRICEQLNQYTSMHDTKALELYYQTAVQLLQYINEKKLQERLAFKTGLYKLMNFSEYQSWTDAGNYLFDLSEAIFSLEGENGEEAADRSLQKLKDYIEGHLAEDLSLTKLAEVSGFNASYLSRIFKKNYGKGLAEYIVEKRMELAKILLLSTDDRIQDIAVKTGYLSAHSFARTFRGYEGVSPTEYRERRK